jgi:hypothetical protein
MKPLLKSIQSITSLQDSKDQLDRVTRPLPRPRRARLILASISVFTVSQDRPASRSFITRRPSLGFWRTSSITSWLAFVSTAASLRGGKKRLDFMQPPFWVTWCPTDSRDLNHSLGQEHAQLGRLIASRVADLREHLLKCEVELGRAKHPLVAPNLAQKLM